MNEWEEGAPLFYEGDALYQAKLAKVQNALRTRGLDALLLLKHDAVRYVTGFYTKGYRPFIDFDYAALVLPTGAPVLGFTTGGEQRRIALRSRVNDARHLPKLADWASALATILRDYGLTRGRVGFDLLPHFVYEGLRVELTGLEWVDASGIWTELTAVKHPLEVEWIRQALVIAQAGVSAALDALAPGKSEIEISAAGEYAIRVRGSELNPFIPVVASGSNAAMWERVATPRRIQTGEMVILDFGCVYHGYTGDFARTTIVGEPSARQRKLYRAAHESLQAATGAVKPGVLCSEIDRIARRVLEDAGYGKYQHPWATGHQLGYGLHGQPLLGRGVDVPLLAGMVVNIEPSLYTFDDPSVGGVEIEDTVLVTDNGHQWLTHFPYDEKLMA